MREMKDSEIEWIGEIPKNWGLLKIKYLVDDSEETDFIDGDWIESLYIIDDGIPYFTTGNIGDGYFKASDNGYISEDTFRILNCKYAYSNDLVISRLNEPYGRSCILPNDIGNCVLAVDIVILRPKKDISKQFICYVTQCSGYQDSVLDYARGTTMKRISRTNLGDIKIPIPPSDVQRTISDFLDDKCAEIDELTSDIGSQIDMLEQYKRSVITEAVTKGLNPDAEMKDSGVEWIGEIPEKWQMLKLKYITSHNDEALSENTDKDFVFDYIDIGAIKDNKIVSLQRMNFAEAPSRARRVVQRDDIIVSTVRTYLKAIAIINDFDVQQIASTGFIVLRANSNVLMPQFLKYSVLSESFIDMVEANSVGITYPAINESKVVEIKIPVPLLQEQKEIADYLDDKCSSMDAVIADKQSQLDTLAEYKKSLIYEYVTGKKEVPTS